MLRLLAIMLFLLGLSLGSDAKVYLVSVGIADYPGEEDDLTLPVNDAKTIAWLYGKNSDVECKLLTNSQATCSNITAAMENLFGKASKDDIVVLFFSGHGYQGGFVAYDNLLSYKLIRKAMAQSKSANKIIFADACFSGKIRTKDKEDESEVRKANVMLFLSSRSSEKSIERKSMKNGFFTTYLQKGLRGGADINRDRTITAKELYTYVHEGVIKISKGKQHPVMWGNFPDTMPVIKW